jgi:mannose-6-phosphate isomerase-like protein (cupin superfamily)
MRLRFEQEGFVTLEREVDIAAGRARRVEVMLSAAPAAAPPAAPPAEPAPAPTPTEPAGEPVTLMIPDFVEKNFIGRAPYKESLLACTAVATVTLLQFRDPLELHTHDRADEILYVVAGEAVHQIGERTERVTFGSLIVVPRGTPHSMTRRGSNPVIALSIAAGQPCQAPVVASR